MTDTTETQSSPSDDGDDNNKPERIQPLTGSLQASGGQQVLVRRLAQLRSAKKELEAEEKLIAKSIKDELIEASAATMLGENGVTIARITMFDRTQVDGKMLEALHPEIFEECSKTNQVIQVRLA